MKYCCDKMKYFVSQNKNVGDFNSDDIIYYAPQFDEYGIVIHDSGKSYIKMDYCPWCGRKLPDSKRNLWFDELEKLGIDDPLETKIPDDFISGKWWKKTSC